MVNELSVVRPVGIIPYKMDEKTIAKKDAFNDKVFKDCQKNVKGTEVRDADWGLYAAQICLAKDLVNADYNNAKLITAKMDFLQKMINQNMDQDQIIFIQDEDQKIKSITAKADAKSKVIPARAAAVVGTINATSNAMDSVGNLAVKTTDLVNTVKGHKLDLVA